RGHELRGHRAGHGLPDRYRALADLQGARGDCGAVAPAVGDAQRQEVVEVNERISVLMDGELDERAADEAIRALRVEGEPLEAWRTYHLISDAMRDTRLLSAGFTARFAQRLAAEPTVIAPANLRRSPAKRVALAAAASVAGVGLVGWLAFAPGIQAPQPQALQP